MKLEIKMHHVQGNAIPAGRAVARFSVKTILFISLSNFNFIDAGVDYNLKPVKIG